MAIETKSFLDNEGIIYFAEKLGIREDEKDNSVLDAGKKYADSLASNYDPAGTAQTKVNALEQGQVKTNKETIEKLDGDVSVEGSVKKQIADAKQEAIEAAETPIATSTKAGKVMVGDDFDVTAEGKITLYKAVSVNSFSNNVNTVEKGKTINDVTLSWSINKVPTSLTLDGETVDVSTNNKSITGLALKTDKTWTLKAVDARNASSQKTTSINFRNGRYWGIGEVDADGVDDAFVQGLTKELASNNTKTFTVTAGVDKYIYYAHPASFGTPVFNVGGFEGGFDLIKTFDYTNASGFTESYKVWKSTNANLGNTTVVVK